MPLRRYKQTILFVLILVVPCVAIALLGWRDFNRDRDKRVKDAEDRQTSEVRSNLLQTLQQVKLQEISGAPSGPGTDVGGQTAQYDMFAIGTQRLGCPMQ